MNTYLKIGDRLLNGDQIISALVQYKLLDNLVGQVLLDEAISQVSLSQQELLQALGGSANTPIPEDFDSFLTQWCQRQGIARDYFNAVLLRQLRVEKFKQLGFGHQVESEFLRRKPDFDQVEYSLIQIEDLPLAQELYFLLRDDGVEFAQLARQHSLGSERETDGWIGPVPLSSLPDEVITLLRNGQVGEIYGPIPVEKRFWIIRLERLKLARLTQKTRKDLIDWLFDRWLQVQTQSLIGTPGSIAVQTLEQPTQIQNELIPNEVAENEMIQDKVLTD